MGNIQSFNNFASTIMNTFSLSFINKRFKKKNLKSITQEQYSQFKDKGVSEKAIKNLGITSKQQSELKTDFENQLRERVDFPILKKKYNKLTLQQYRRLSQQKLTFRQISDFLFRKEINSDFSVEQYKQY